jgi:hypothetical protein
VAEVWSSAPKRSRRFWATAGLIAAFYALDLALFAGLIYRSLKQRELDRVIDETRQGARELAARVQESAERTGGDLYTAVLLERETQRYVDTLPQLRTIVEAIEITDRQGVLVMRERRPPEVVRPDGVSESVPGDSLSEWQGTRRAPAADSGSDETVGQPSDGQLEVVEPIGDYGSLRIRLSQVEIGPGRTAARRTGAPDRDHRR